MKKTLNYLVYSIILLIFVSCSTLSRTQRMERDMFDPQPTRLEKKAQKDQNVSLPKNKVKMPSRK